MKDTTTSMSDGQEKKPEGGSDWELSEAIKLMGEATASGDPQQIARAMRRHAEALTNAANTIMIPTLKSVLESVVKKEIDALSLHINNSDRARLDWNTKFQEELQSRLDGHALILDADVKSLAASMEGAAIATGKAFRLAEEAQAGVGMLTGRVEILETHGAPAVVVSELHQLRADVENIYALLILTRRQLWLTFAAVAAIALIFVLAILAGGGR
jgi:hypothetical protein